MRSLGVASLAGGLVVAACSTAPASPATADGDALRVVATTTVLADLVRQVGGPSVDVESLVPPGGEVHTFDPTPSDLRTVAEAELIVMNGLGLDEWLADVITDSGSTAPSVELAEDLRGVAYLEGEEHEEGEGEHEGEGSGAPAAEEEHHHEGVNPHLWLNVAYAQLYVDRIAGALAEADPDDADVYRAGGEAYRDRLGALDAEIRAALAGIPDANRRIVSFHEAYPYYAAAYGLEVIGTIVDAPGQDPSAGDIATLVEAIRASGAKAVFTEAQFSPALAEAVATEAGIHVVSDLYNDSLGDPPVDTYEGMMRWNTDKTVEALR